MDFYALRKQIVKKEISGIILAGTNSGCGKTTVCCAVLKALVGRGLKVGAFKCGPDYIDPTFHRYITGQIGANLDPFFFDDDTLRYLLAKHGGVCDVSIVEGVMGYYDGVGGTEKGSTYDVARITGLPVVLVIDAEGASLSALAALEGFANFKKDSGIRGVIFNRCSPGTYEILEKEIQERFHGEIIPLGYLPRDLKIGFESRNLGLVIADEIDDIEENLTLLALEAEATLKLDSLLALAVQKTELTFEPPVIEKFDEPVRIAVARDRAFCFYYEEALELLREMGAEIVPFSPLRDKKLPDIVHGLYLGGGYPELYADKLSRNAWMRESIKSALAGGLPCIAECGGFMYLHESINGAPMVGMFMGDAFNKGRLGRFGYVTLTAEKDNMLCKKGENIAAHEFHYWDFEFCGDDFTAEKANGKSWKCAFAFDTLYAGFPHFHFYSNPRFAENFYRACIGAKNAKD